MTAIKYNQSYAYTWIRTNIFVACSLFHLEFLMTSDIIFQREKVNRSDFRRRKFWNTSVNFNIMNWQKSGFVRPDELFVRSCPAGLEPDCRTGSNSGSRRTHFVLIDEYVPEWKERVFVSLPFTKGILVCQLRLCPMLDWGRNLYVKNKQKLELTFKNTESLSNSVFVMIKSV
jgi:hypothetical protein